MKSKSGWQLREDGPEAYEKYVVPAFSGVWAEDMVERANLRHNDKVLDLGCGTGIVSRYAYQAMGGSVHITGLDLNEIVLTKAREICPPDKTSIEWKQGAVESLPFADAEFDVVLCQQGLQYFSDRPLALREVKRVLAPKGRVVFSVWRSLNYHPFYKALHRVLERYVSAETALTLSSAYILGSAKQLRELFEAAGFKKIKICIVIKQMRYAPFADFLAGGLAASPFANEILQLKKSKRNEIFQSIHDSILDYLDDYGLAAPMESHIVFATR